MGYPFKLFQIPKKRCSRWSEIEFVDYYLSELSPEQQAETEVHLSICLDCRERFQLCLSIISKEYSAEEERADKEFLSSPSWKRRKVEIARNLAKTGTPYSSV